jgi:hypothetical protein
MTTAIDEFSVPAFLFKFMIQFIFGNEKIKVYLNKKIQRIHSKNDRLEIIKNYHDSMIEGHGGIERTRTFKRMKEKYFWPLMKKDITEFIKVCHKCQINKTKHKMKIPLKITSTSDKPFSKISNGYYGSINTI